MTTVSRPLSIAMAGFGTVGRAAARLICKGRHPSLRLAAICTRRPDASRRDAPWVPSNVFWTGDIDALLARRADVFVELIGGTEPAQAWIAAALQAGLAVVTANKQVIAEHGPDLFALARSRNLPLRFEAAVGGAVPVIRGLEEGLAGDRVTRIAGVVNGTCNFVLGRMTDGGVSLDDAVREAQARGFAEADPAADLDGLDARAKLSILATIGLGSRLPPRRIPTGTIRGIDAGDIAAAASVGCVIRQVAWAGRPVPESDEIAAGVSAALVRCDSWLGQSRGPENVILVQGERSGTTVFAGQGAGGDATAVAVVSDLLAVAHQRSVPRPWPVPFPAGAPFDVVRAHYVRVSRPGASGRRNPQRLLESAGIDVNRMLSSPDHGTDRWAAVLRPCRRADLNRALEPLAQSGAIPSTVISLPFVDTEA